MSCLKSDALKGLKTSAPSWRTKRSCELPDKGASSPSPAASCCATEFGLAGRLLISCQDMAVGVAVASNRCCCSLIDSFLMFPPLDTCSWLLFRLLDIDDMNVEGDALT